jgi:phenylalanyl-tRNA synthetase alpha chain
MSINYKSIVAEIAKAQDLNALEVLRVKHLGRKSQLVAELSGIGSLEPKDRGAAGKQLNEAKLHIEKALLEQKTKVEMKLLEQAAAQDAIDVTLPTQTMYGHAHPALQVIDDIVRTFVQMGYTVVDGPEVEDEWHNFEALNIPAGHPARDMQDTFYLEGGNLPRTHTSGVQIRFMENNQPPIRIICPGKVYRNEDEDARHSWSFYQIEGLVVDKGVSLADLKGTLLAMAQGVLGKDAQIRLRLNYFPYTEPSVEMDATCILCKGSGCDVCSQTGWLEMGGAGMVHPQVLRNVGLDPDVYSGFAFGFGPERLAMIKYQMPDVREFWRPTMKFLEQF